MSNTIVRDSNVATLINQAGRAGNTMLAKVRQAAAKAAAQLDPAKPVNVRIGDVVALYADDFKAAGHNIKSLFTDALTLHACASTDVVVRTIGKDGKAADEPVKAAAAVDMSKHVMREAAKQVREAHGMGRKSGGGRKAAARVVAAKPEDNTTTAQHVDAFAAWLDNLDEFFTDAVYHEKIVARFIELGYTVSKAAKGRVVKGKASA